MSVGRILTAGLGVFGGVNYLPTLGLGNFGSKPVPTPPGSGSSGGDSQWTPPGWLLDQLYDEERLRAEEKKVKRAIKAVAKKKEALQQSLQRPRGVDLSAVIAQIQELSAQLQALLGTYALIQSAMDDMDEQREGDELIDLLIAMEGMTLQ